MARQRRRQYGSGCLFRRGRGWAIRWREMEIAPDGTRRRVQRYEALGEVTRKQASDKLAQRMAAGDNGGKPTRSRVVFRALAAEWQAHVLPMYKHSTQKNHRHILEKHLLPRFGDKAIVRNHASGGSGLRGSLGQQRIRTQDNGPHSRCPERGTPHSRQVGPSPGQSCAGSRSTSANQRATEMGTHHRPGISTARGVAADAQDNGRCRVAVWAPARRAVRASMERPRRRASVSDRARGRLRG